MKIKPEHLDEGILKSECGPGAFERGRAYHKQGRARLLDVEHDARGRLHLSGLNIGSGNRRYRQSVEIARDSGGVFIVGECDCPVGFNCKHVVATCLAWRDRSGTETDPTAGFESWLARFVSTATPAKPDTEEQLLYLLSPETPGSNRMAVDLQLARIKRDGNWGKGRRVTPGSVFNRWDRPRWMSDADAEIISLAATATDDPWLTRLLLNRHAGQTALDLMIDTGRMFWGDDRSRALVRGPEREAVFEWAEDEGRFRPALDLPAEALLVAVTPPWYVDPETGQVGPVRLPAGLDADRLALLREAPPIRREDAEQVSRLLALQVPELPRPVDVPIEDVHQQPVPNLRIDFDPRQPRDAALALAFRYADVLIDSGEPSEALVRELDERLLRIHRDPSGEAGAVELLQGTGLVVSPDAPGRFILAAETGQLRDAWLAWLDTELPRLSEAGWEVTWPEGQGFSLNRAEAVDAEVDETGNDWFGLRFDLEVDGSQVALLPLISQLLDDYQPDALPETVYLDAGEGQFIAVESERLRPVLDTILDLFDRTTADGESLELSRFDAPRLLELGETRVAGAKQLKTLARKLANFDGIKPVKLPTTFKGELREYQQHGVNWLQFLREYGFGGILADDMGLGKTIQTLAHLAVEKRAGRMRSPCLIVAPTSLMGNWRREAAQFTPKLKVLVLHGPDRSFYFDALDQVDIVLTTYPLLPRDHEVLCAQDWHCLILDEAQQIKNPRAKAAQVARALSADQRLCLTGTPMENHLGELWAQFDFLMPGFLGDHRGFTRSYRTPIEQHGDSEKMQRLSKRVAPFMLRRTKDRVAAELPAKSELLRTTAIEGKQATLYESIRLTMEKKVREAIAQRGLARSHITVLDALLKLRQVCCDPRLLPRGTHGASGAPSAKLALLMEILPELLEEGRRVLLFSQFTTMLGLIEREVTARGIAYTKLTGQTRKREQAIERFRSGEVNLFLISLKAGGVGLNLTEADTVIHYDPWWNPAVETQATDRAHRIGQDKPVFVYKLITEGTVEEKILALQEKKRRLVDRVHGEGENRDQPPIDAETIQALLADE